jgi:copper chaperone
MALPASAVARTSLAPRPGCGRSQAANMEIYAIQGMTCDHCTRAVARALAKLPGVTRVVGVDLAHGEARIEGSPDEAAVVAAVKEEGYEARRLPRHASGA